MKRVILSSLSRIRSADSPSNELIVYHRSSKPFNGWDESKIVDLGLHASTDPNNPRRGDLYKLVLDKSKFSELVLNEDLSNYETIEALRVMYSYLGQPTENARRDRDAYAKQFNIHVKGREEKSLLNRGVLMSKFGINILIYPDMYDDAGDTCVCILSPDLIKSWDKIEVTEPSDDVDDKRNLDQNNENAQ